MTLVPLTDSEEFHVHDPRQDCRGWPVTTTEGRDLGRVEELLVDPDRDRVAMLRLIGGYLVPVESVALRDNVVVVRDESVLIDPPTTSEPVEVAWVDGYIRVGRRLALD